MSSGTVFVRASSLADLMDCPARWEAKHILKMYSPTGGAAQLGTAVHAGAEVFDVGVMTGAGVSIDDAAGAVVDAIWKPENEVIWDEDTPQKTAEQIALALHTKYCSEISPKMEYAGVEVKCEPLEIPELGLTLTGTTDRIRITDEGKGIADLKTGARAVGTDGKVSTSGHIAQMGVYELLAEQAGHVITAPAVIIGMQTAKTKQRVGLGVIENARARLIGTEDEPGLLEYASKIINSGLFFANPRSMLCGPKFCPRFSQCKYR